MKKKVVILGLSALILTFSATVGAILLILQPQDIQNSEQAGDGVFAISTADTIKTLEYNFSALEQGDGVRMNTFFLYKQPCKLSENPELSTYGQMVKSMQSELRMALKTADETEIDINELVFEGQIYYKGWIYFNLTDNYIYHNGRMYKFYGYLTYNTKYLRENYNLKEYKGNYKFGESLEKHHFISGTVVEYGKGYALKLFEDEPLAQVCELVRPANSVEVGKKITMEYVGYVELGDPAVIMPVGVYDYDEEFEYEKTMPDILNVAVCSAYESEVFQWNDPQEYLPFEIENYRLKPIKVLIETYDEFKPYESFYKAAFNFTYKADFFNENNLVFIYFQKGTGSCAFTYTDIYIEGSAVNVIMDDGVNAGDAVNDDMGNYSFTVALPKSETKNCTEIVLEIS